MQSISFAYLIGLQVQAKEIPDIVRRLAGGSNVFVQLQEGLLAKGVLCNKTLVETKSVSSPMGML